MPRETIKSLDSLGTALSLRFDWIRGVSDSSKLEICVLDSNAFARGLALDRENASVCLIHEEKSNFLFLKLSSI